MSTKKDLRMRLAEVIEAGGYGSQSKLPTERVLAEMLGATRWSVRKTLDLLEAEGKVWRHVGRGTFVGARPEPDAENLSMLCAHSRPSELIEARMMIEPALAALAAMRASPAQIGKIREAAHKCMTARNMEVYEIWDVRLHGAIAEASGNLLLRSIFHGLDTVRKKIVWGRLKRSVLRPDRRRFYSGHHEKIVDAIANRDPEAARRAMVEHMHALETVYLNIERAGLGDHHPVSL